MPTWTSILFKKVFSCSFDFVHFPWVVSEVLQNAACLDVSLSLIGPPLIGQPLIVRPLIGPPLIGPPLIGPPLIVLFTLWFLIKVTLSRGQI